jgi:hypothetical protein
MASRAAAQKTHEEDDRARLLQRLEDLELRVKLLEARVRSTLSKAGAREASGDDDDSSSRPRPRCPGCTLELPKGKRGDSCVWCGFQFDALGANFR